MVSKEFRVAKNLKQVMARAIRLLLKIQWLVPWQKYSQTESANNAAATKRSTSIRQFFIGMTDTVKSFPPQL